MTLCGVLKDVLLVAASIAIWGTPISLLQYFGYSIALCGLVYYKLGAKPIKEKAADAQRAWAEYGATHPALRKLIVFAMVVMMMLTVMGAVAPSVGYDPAYITNAVKSGGKTS